MFEVFQNLIQLFINHNKGMWFGSRFSMVVTTYVSPRIDVLVLKVITDEFHEQIVNLYLYFVFSYHYVTTLDSQQRNS